MRWPWTRPNSNGRAISHTETVIPRQPQGAAPLAPDVQPPAEALSSALVPSDDSLALLEQVQERLTSLESLVNELQGVAGEAGRRAHRAEVRLSRLSAILRREGLPVPSASRSLDDEDSAESPEVSPASPPDSSGDQPRPRVVAGRPYHPDREE